MKKEYGITLIALVISIIVLIILAGVAINTLINNGIIDKAKTATQEYKNAQDYEETQIAKYTNDINSYVNGNRDYTPINFSTNEQDTGMKWIDGSIVYQRTYTSDTVGKTEIDTIQNIKLLNVTGHIINNYDGNILSIGYSGVGIGYTPNGILYISASYTLRGYNITIQYTKIPQIDE